jgi:hypothetical protein
MLPAAIRAPLKSSILSFPFQFVLLASSDTVPADWSSISRFQWSYLDLN